MSMSMSILDWMDIVYPTATALCLGYIVAKCVFFCWIRKTRVVLFDVLFMITELVVLFLLSIQTGKKPPFDINQYRYIVVWSRAVMSAVLLLCIVETIRVIRLHVEAKDEY